MEECLSTKYKNTDSKQYDTHHNLRTTYTLSRQIAEKKSEGNPKEEGKKRTEEGKGGKGYKEKRGKGYKEKRGKGYKEKRGMRGKARKRGQIYEVKHKILLKRIHRLAYSLASRQIDGGRDNPEKQNRTKAHAINRESYLPMVRVRYARAFKRRVGRGKKKRTIRTDFRFFVKNIRLSSKEKKKEKNSEKNKKPSRIGTRFKFSE